jgi:hypothetical protein
VKRAANVRKQTGTKTRALRKLSIRLTATIDRETRAEVNKKGELSNLITDAIFGVNLLNMEVVDLDRARDQRLKVTVKQTQISVSDDTYERVAKAAATRGCSLNSIVNSALLAFLRKSANKAALDRRQAE